MFKNLYLSVCGILAQAKKCLDCNPIFLIFYIIGNTNLCRESQHYVCKFFEPPSVQGFPAGKKYDQGIPAHFFTQVGISLFEYLKSFKTILALESGLRVDSIL